MTSSINPNDIDQNYPVAGQDNNSQGFRDNFFNIKQNFQYAENEINDLQAKVLLKAALTGQVLDNNMNDNLLYAAKIQDFSATKVSISPLSGIATVNYASGHYQTVTVSSATANAGTVTLAFINWPTANSYGALRIQVYIDDPAYTLTLPASVSLGLSGIQGISPGTSGVANVITFAAAGYYEFGFSTSDGGTTITLFDLNRALTNFSGGSLTVTNLSSSGYVSAVGNVTGGNIRTAGTVSATANVIGGNITTAGSVNATANVAGGNITTAGIVSSTGNVLSQTGIAGPIYPATGTGTVPAVQFTSGAVLNSATAGALEYDGVVFYGTPKTSQRGVTENTHFVVTPTGGYALSNSSSAQAVFGTPASGTITLPASTSYFMEAMYIITRAAGTTGHTISTLFTVGSALTSITYTAETISASTTPTPADTVSLVYATAATATTVTNTSTSATENVIIKLSGIIQTNGATTLIPQIQYSSAPGGAPTVLQNSYFKLTPIGTSTVTSVGNWS